MSTIAYTNLTKPLQIGYNGTAVVQWPAMGNADTGQSFSMPARSDRSVQVEGTFGGATCTLQGTNDGTNWETLKDAFGNVLTFTTAGLRTIIENCQSVRPITASGTGTSLNVTICAKGQPS